MDSLLNRIVLLTKSRKLTGKELGALLGLKKTPLTDWKNGKSSPTMNQIIKMCDIFAVSADYLLMGNEKDITILDCTQNSADTELLKIFHQLPPNERNECIAYLKGYLAHSLKTAEEIDKRKNA